MADHAERNGPFIFWCIKKIWGERQTYKVNTQDDIKAIPKNQSGLYIFYLDSGVHKYIIYVGITRRSFQQRFQEHYERNTGVIYKCNTGVFPQNQPPIRLPLKALLVPDIYPMQAKLMESVFLEQFNFCLNSDENGDTREILDTGKEFRPEDTKPNFDITFDNIMASMKDVYAQYKR